MKSKAQRTVVHHKLIARRTISGFVIMLMVLISFGVKAQNFQHWNELVGWDGQTDWRKYFILSPAYFGPNALPVPELKSGLIQNESFFEYSINHHFSVDGPTSNVFVKFYKSFEGRVSVEAFMVPLEYYKLTEEARDKRLARSPDPKGFAVGDLYFGTNIQLIKSKDRFPDLTLGLYGKTTSGSKIEDARFTDTPGHYFDLSFGKNFRHHSALRWYGSLGFYSFQTNLNQYLQNDAIIYGTGIQLNNARLCVDAQLTGYFGYIGLKELVVVSTSKTQYIYDGDQPLVFRINIKKSYHNNDLIASTQIGLHDFPYQSITFGFRYHLKNK